MAKSNEEGRRKALGAYIKAKMAEREINFPELGRRLEQHGGEAVERTVLFNKVTRGSFSATFLLELVNALDIDSLSIEDIDQYLPASGGDA